MGQGIIKVAGYSRQRRKNDYIEKNLCNLRNLWSLLLFLSNLIMSKYDSSYNK